MPERHGVAYRPGVQGMISCSYTCSQGITPGIATLEILEQDVSRIQGFGDLTITDGFNGITLRKGDKWRSSSWPNRSGATTRGSRPVT